MQIEGSANEAIVKRIEDVIQENYEESLATLITVNTTHVLDDRIFIVHLVSAWEGDDEYTIHTETLRVDVVKDAPSPLTFTLLIELDLDLVNELK